MLGSGLLWSGSSEYGGTFDLRVAVFRFDATGDERHRGSAHPTEGQRHTDKLRTSMANKRLRHLFSYQFVASDRARLVEMFPFILASVDTAEVSLSSQSDFLSPRKHTDDTRLA